MIYIIYTKNTFKFYIYLILPNTDFDNPYWIAVWTAASIT